MKYVLFKTKHADCDQLVPVIFPNQLVHSIVAEHFADALKLHGKETVEVYSAGEITFEGTDCFGMSESLSVFSKKEEDAKLISMYDYLHGLV